MNVINCSECGRVFQPLVKTKVCPICKKYDEEKFMSVKDYIYDNPSATIEEVVEFVGITREKVIKFIKQGRLETIGSHMVIECETCGKMITSGKYCAACSHDMAKSFSSAARTLQQTRSNKSVGMHTRKK